MSTKALGHLMKLIKKAKLLNHVNFSGMAIGREQMFELV